MKLCNSVSKKDVSTDSEHGDSGKIRKKREKCSTITTVNRIKKEKGKDDRKHSEESDMKKRASVDIDDENSGKTILKRKKSSTTGTVINIEKEDANNNIKYPEEFDTISELRAYVIHTIQIIGLSDGLRGSNPEVYAFFVSLFQRHPEKEKKEVSLITDINIRRFPKANPKGPLCVSDHQFFIIKSDGTEDSISWNSCVTGAINPVEKRLNWAMRNAIVKQIIEFKMANKKKPCEFCGTYSNPTADHIVKFMKLKDDFLLLNPLYPTEFSKNVLAQEVFREEDIAFTQSWYDYHRENATLRILCKECNQKLDNYSWLQTKVPV